MYEAPETHMLKVLIIQFLVYSNEFLWGDAIRARPFQHKALVKSAVHIIFIVSGVVSVGFNVEPAAFRPAVPLEAIAFTYVAVSPAF